MRLKFFTPAPSSTQFRTADDFKESEHPRAANGQFGSGGGGTGKQHYGGVTAPKKGSSAHNIWAFAAMCEEKGLTVNTANVVAQAEAAGVQLNKSNTQQTLPLFKKYQAGAKAEGAKPMAAPTETAKPKMQPTAENFVKVSSESGLSLEGTYSGIMYYKNPEGVKASFSGSTKSWQLKDPNGNVTKGTGMEELEKGLQVLTKQTAESKAANAAKQEAQKKEAAANALKLKAEQYNTLNAALYGHKAAVKGEHQYSSNGAANEKAFAPGIQKSLGAYTGSSYKQINHAMRFSTDYDGVDATTMRHILNLERAFKLAPPTTSEINVGRKVGMEALKTMAKDAGLHSLMDIQPGMELRDSGIISTSHSKGIWSGQVRFDVKVPPGSKAIDLSETINKGEQEMLLPPGSGFRVTKVTHGDPNSGHAIHIECEHIP